MTKAQVLRSLNYWRGIMSLGDWDIEFEPVDADEFLSEAGIAAYADVTYNVATRSANVKIALKRDKACIQRSIRHELSHLLLADMQDVSNEAAQLLGGEAATLVRSRTSDSGEVVVRKLDRAFDKVLGEAGEE